MVKQIVVISGKKLDIAVNNACMTLDADPDKQVTDLQFPDAHTCVIVYETNNTDEPQIDPNLLPYSNP